MNECFYLHSGNVTRSVSSSFSGSGFGNSSAARTMQSDDSGEPSPSIVVLCELKKKRINQLVLFT